MNELISKPCNLPANIEDLAKFILVSQERLVSIRAEIRALTKTGLLKEIMEQKREEARMVSDALLDAQMRFGEITKALPKTSGGDRKSTDFQKSEVRTFENNPKPKLEIVKSLGFSKQRINEFETLANNPDIVEQVKAEARENDDLPTRSRVLQLVKEKKKAEKPSANIVSQKQVNRLVNTIVETSNIDTDKSVLESWLDTLADEEEFNFNLMMIDEAIEKLRTIKSFMTSPKNRRS